ncbi:MAG: demethoxyubiquinone hydroxylase family protein [Myxococcota bacterium]
MGETTDAARLDGDLRAELAAATTYEQALLHVEGPQLRNLFEKNRKSHAARAVTLGQMIRRRGTTPSQTAGLWSAFAILAERTAANIGEHALIQALHQGEKLLTSRYRAHREELDEAMAPAFESHVLEPQMTCQRRLAEVLPS